MRRSRIQKIKSIMPVIGRVALMIIVIDIIAFAIILVGENASSTFDVLSESAWQVLKKEMLFVLLGAAAITCVHIGVMRTFEITIRWWIFVGYEAIVAFCGATIAFTIRIIMISFGEILLIYAESLRVTDVPYALIIWASDIAMILTVLLIVHIGRRGRRR